MAWSADFLWFYRLYRQSVYAIYGLIRRFYAENLGILFYMLPAFLSARGPDSD